MDLQLSERVAIVTGAGRGIGRAISETLAAEGMRLALAARSGGELDALASALGTECMPHVADLREPEAPAALVRATLDRFGRLDLLVNNAGATKRGDFLALPDSDWTDGFALKFYGAMRACRAAWPHLMARQGSIVNIVGIGGRTGTAEFGIGGAVNAALLNLTKVLADRGTKDGVRVNAINPGWIATDRLATRVRAYAQQHQIGEDEARRRLAEGLGIARFGEPAEVGRIVAFLASPQSGYLQGSIIDVDGGQTRTL